MTHKIDYKVLYKIPLRKSQEFILLDQLTFEWLTSEPNLVTIDFINNLESHNEGHIFFKDSDGKIIILANQIIKGFFKPLIPSTKGYNLSHLNGNLLDFRLENLEYQIKYETIEG